MINFTFKKNKRSSKPKECEEIIIDTPSNFDKRRCDSIRYTITNDGIKATVMKNGVQVGNFGYTSLNKDIAKISLTQSVEHTKSTTGKVG